MTLKEYQEKRRFAVTPEPAGEVKETGERRFVVQRHQASRLHYDFRLQMEGVLKSWAVPKGPPEDPGVRRLAVQVEDHPVDYIDFAGEIPGGQYGAGKVEIWDRGSYELEGARPDHFDFVLHGERLTGRYTLVHTRGDNWILLKRR
jgi:bifunctional non-homologous end joining protein LigD